MTTKPILTCEACNAQRRCVVVVESSTCADVAACHVCRGHNECESCDEDAEERAVAAGEGATS